MNNKTIINGVLGVTVFVGSVVSYELYKNNEELTTANITLQEELNKDKQVIGDLVKVNKSYRTVLEKKDEQVKKLKKESKVKTEQIHKLKLENKSYKKALHKQSNESKVATTKRTESKVVHVKTNTTVNKNTTPKLSKSSNSVSGGQTFNVTFYSSEYASTGRNPGDKYYGITASGTKATLGRTIACPPQYNFGTKINIEGIGVRVCEDRGGAIKGNHLDVYVSSESEAYRLGRQYLKGQVVN